MTTLTARTLLALFGAAIVAGTAAPAAAQATPASLGCASAKQKDLGKTAAAVLNCHSKAAKLGATVDASCVQKAKDKWGLALDKADLKGGCATEARDILFGGTGAGEKQGLYDLVVDETEVVADGLADVLVPRLRPDTAANTCQSAKLKAAGKLAASLLDCHSKASKKGIAVDEECLNKALVKLNDPSKGAFAKAEAKDGCVTTGDAGSTQTAVVAFVEQALVVTPRNDGCGSGFTIAPETCDDGNLVNTDNCPSDCTVDPCTPDVGSDDTWVVQFSSPKPIAAARVFVDYPEGKVNIPGSGDVTLGGDITDILDNPFTVASMNDQDHGLTATLAEGTASPTGFSVTAGDLFTVHFETCLGAPAAVAGDFACTVVDAADPAAKPLAGVTCTVN
jgi:cysteine-rich repeat protein